MKLKVLGSGSSGNCYILENDKEALIIEAGVSFKEVKIALDFNIRKIVGVIVGHRHKDHSGYMCEYEKAGIHVFRPYEIEEWNDEKMKYYTVGMGTFRIKPFPLVHDVPCFGFYITHPDIGSLLYASDTEYIKYRFKNLNHILVEANYCNELIDNDNPKYQHVLEGHMSIDTACGFLKSNNNPGLRNVVLLHLSKDAANPEMFKDIAGRCVSCPVHVARKGLEIELSLPF